MLLHCDFENLRHQGAVATSDLTHVNDAEISVNV
jgi:hypothetical protein